jgi:MerR family transcriptional regulator, light-induced transcriptional regulator
MAELTGGRLTLDEVADRLGVHYMTVYRYVRVGRLDAHHQDGRWWVEPAALEAFAAGASPPSGTRSARWNSWRGRLHSRLTAGDVSGAWAIVEGALGASRPTVELYVQLLGPVLRQIGEEWASGTLGVDSEHRASAVALRLLGRIGPLGMRSGRRRRATIVLGGAPGDAHQLPGLMVADALRWEGFGVVDLGADVPLRSFLDVATSTPDVAAIGISVSVDDHRPECAEVLEKLRDVAPSALLLAGGPALADEESARALGADGWAPHAGALAALVRTAL